MNHVIGIGEWFYSENPEDVIVTYALGSCVAIIATDKNKKIAAMAHIALPLSHIDPERAKKQPAYFADTGVPLILETLKQKKLSPKDIEIKLIGGAQMLDPKGIFDIGKRNILEIKKILWQYMMVPIAEDVGGNVSRSVFLYVGKNKVIVSSQNQHYEI